MKKNIFVFLIGFSFFLSSCDLLRTSPFIVESWSPGEGFHNDPSGIKISLLFSGESDRIKTEQAFSLTEDSKTLTGVFSWEGNRLTFTPFSPLEPNRDYSIILGTGAQDTKGISLETKFEASFTTRAADDEPKIIKTEPEHESYISGGRAEFRVYFSGRVTLNSCIDFVTFEPHTPGSWRLADEEKTACFTPRESWQTGTAYRVRVKSGFAGFSGAELGNDYSSVFYVAQDREKPVLLKARAVDPSESFPAVELTPGKSGAASAVCYAQWEKFTQLELVFSEQVDGSVLKNLVSTEPPVPLVMDSSPGAASESVPSESVQVESFPTDSAVEAAQVFRFRFAEYPAWGSQFLFRVGPGVQDNAGNESAEEYVFKIICAGPLSKPPVLAGIRMPLAPGNKAEVPGGSENQKAADFTPEDLFADLPVEDGEGRYPYMKETRTWVELYFETAPETEIDLLSVMELFRVESTNNALTFSPRSISADNFTWTNPREGWEKFGRVEISGVLKNTVQTGVVSFNILSGLRDSRGNRSDEEFRIALQK